MSGETSSREWVRFMTQVVWFFENKRFFTANGGGGILYQGRGVDLKTQQRVGEPGRNGLGVRQEYISEKMF